jgi:glycosyltransferase involved in cell wall biosynthesis
MVEQNRFDRVPKTSSHSESSRSADAPFVTIAIPTFNRASWLKGCILSALAQSYEHFEVVVSDNASTDETGDVLKALNDPRLRVVRQERNIGLVPNWNACLEEAKGEYIVIVSDDDRIEPWLLERCVALVRRGPQLPIVLTLTDVNLIEEGRIRKAQVSTRYETGVWDGADILLEYFYRRISIQMCGIMLRTETVRAAGGFRNDRPYTADITCWAPLLLTGRVGFVNEGCGVYSVHKTSQTSKLTNEIRFNDVQEVVDTISEMADRFIADSHKRSELKLQARFSLALDRLSPNAPMKERLLIIWQCRRSLTVARNSVLLTKVLARLVLPEPIVQVVRRARHGAARDRDGITRRQKVLDPRCWIAGPS